MSIYERFEKALEASTKDLNSLDENDIMSEKNLTIIQRQFGINRDEAIKMVKSYNEQ